VKKARRLSMPVGADEGKADRPLSRAVAALRPWRGGFFREQHATRQTLPRLTKVDGLRAPNISQGRKNRSNDHNPSLSMGKRHPPRRAEPG
jgi:hypothetical protein